MCTWESDDSLGPEGLIQVAQLCGLPTEPSHQPLLTGLVCISKTGSCVAQVDFQLVTQLRLALNFRASLSLAPRCKGQLYSYVLI